MKAITQNQTVRLKKVLIFLGLKIKWYIENKQYFTSCIIFYNMQNKQQSVSTTGARVNLPNFASVLVKNIMIVPWFSGR
jgi:uncharacterized membrane protein YadS